VAGTGQQLPLRADAALFFFRKVPVTVILPGKKNNDSENLVEGEKKLAALRVELMSPEISMMNWLS